MWTRHLKKDHKKWTCLPAVGVAMTRPLISMINLDYFPFYFWKLPWLSRIFEDGSWGPLNPLSPQVAHILIKSNFPFYQNLLLRYWFSSRKQLDLSLVTDYDENTSNISKFNTRQSSLTEQFHVLLVVYQQHCSFYEEINRHHLQKSAFWKMVGR